MPFESFEAFYRSEAQAVILLQALPLAFLAWRAAVPPPHERAVHAAASRFVAAWCLVFAFETLADPWATGPLVHALGLDDAPGGSAIMFVFVWLGDFRVLGLMLGVATIAASAGAGARRATLPRSALLRAAALTCVVPIVAGTLDALLGSVFSGLPGNTLWVIYEVGFLALAIGLGRWWVPRAATDPATAGWLRALAGYSAAYYALWASADLVILGLGQDAGWALRVVPNQLYYGGWVVFAYARFYRAPAADASGGPNAAHHAASSTSTQAER